MVSQLVATLIDQHYFERELLEDKLASKLLMETEQKDWELDQKQLGEVDTWVEKQCEWMADLSRSIHAHGTKERQILIKIEELSPGVDVITEQLRPLLRSYSDTLSTIKPGSTYNPSVLWDMLSTLVDFRHTQRFGHLCKTMLERVRSETEALSAQLVEITNVMRNNRGRRIDKIVKSY